ncbi:MAG: hypothetical protein WAQ31_02710, partial [Arcanobacterium sp.]
MQGLSGLACELLTVMLRVEKLMGVLFGSGLVKSRVWVRVFVAAVVTVVVAVGAVLVAPRSVYAAGLLGEGPEEGGVTVTVPTVELTAVSAGNYHSLAIGDNGKAYALGGNWAGQLGTGDDDGASRFSPMLVDTRSGVEFTAVSAGYYHSLAIGDDGKTYAWGDNRYGQLGNDDEANKASRFSPVLVDTPAGVEFTAVSAGYYHSLAIGDNGQTYAWGYNSVGQLGNDDEANKATQFSPVLVDTPAGVEFTAVSAGYAHSLAIGDDGKTYAWGANWDGQLGTGDDDGAPRFSPVEVDTPAGVKFTAVSAGKYHSLAVGDDGKAYAWGANWFGQLGIGDTSGVSRFSPVPVA